jgi:uncharacterized protein
MRDRRDPRSLDIAALCREGESLTGQWRLAEFLRLADSLFGAPAAEAVADWSAQASLKPVAGGEAERWLHLQAHADVRLQCQRCLEALIQPLQVQRSYRFVQHELEAERQDEEAEEDVLALPPRLDLVELIEDELILALPLVPRHEGTCPSPLPLSAASEEEPAPNPFAKLAVLRHTPPRDESGEA